MISSPQRTSHRRKAICWIWACGLFAIGVFSNLPLVAQNLEQIGKSKPLAISGGLNANNVFYQAIGVERRRDPFNYFLSSNLNISLYGWSIPMSFSYSNQQSRFQQPFNQIGLSPVYKWMTLHLGYRSLSFSNYTMNGHLFFGSGVELQPNARWRVTGFYGRLRKTAVEDTLQSRAQPSYKRMGGGVKVSWTNEVLSVGVVALKVKDDPASLEARPLKSEVLPEENLVLSLDAGLNIGNRLKWQAEVASSAISRDVQSEKARARNFYDGLGSVFTPRVSSAYYQACKSSLQYAIQSISVGISYEKVEPGYRTLGAYYFNNDLETVSLTHSSVFLNKKLRINSQFGTQRTNLDPAAISATHRWSGSLNANYNPSERLGTSFSFSNFQTVVNMKTTFDNLNPGSTYDRDTLNYKQVAQNAMATVNYVINTSKERRQSVGVNGTYQVTQDAQGAGAPEVSTEYYNVNSTYNFLVGRHNLSLTAVLNANISKSSVRNTMWGPTVSLRKTFFDKRLNTSFTLASNQRTSPNEGVSSVKNVRASTGYVWQERHSFDCTMTYVGRTATGESRAVKEWTLQLAYAYVFSLSK